jgi:hypothetical protein
VLETSTSFGPASALTRAPMCTRREEAVARCVHLAATKAGQLRADDGVVRVEQGMPVPVADLRSPARRVHDVGEKHRGQNSVVSDVSLWPVRNSAISRNASRQGSTMWYMLRPGSSTYFASGMWSPCPSRVSGFRTYE